MGQSSRVKKDKNDTPYPVDPSNRTTSFELSVLPVANVVSASPSVSGTADDGVTLSRDPLAAGETNTHVTTGVQDAFGGSLASEFTSSFTTLGQEPH